MRFTILLNAVPFIFAAKHHSDDPLLNSVGGPPTHDDSENHKKPNNREIVSPDLHPRKKEIDSKTDHSKPEVIEETDSADMSPSPWKQYTEGNRDDWRKYMSKPGSNGTDDGTQFDWMKYAAPYMNSNGSNSNSSGGDSSYNWQQFAGQYMGGAPGGNTTSTQWNNGQGDGFGEPFRSQTGGDFRYKAGRDWGNKTGGSDQGGFDWQQFAAPYSDVNPSQPGTQNQSSDTSSGMDWHKYTSGGNSGGDFDWHQYADQYMSGGQGGQGGGQSSGDWQKYAAPYMGGGQPGATDKNPAAQVQAGPASGGYFEVEVSGTNLNVTTTFGLGQGRAANGTSDASGEAGGGGGQQTFMTADEGRIFLRGNFLNKLDPNVVPA